MCWSSLALLHQSGLVPGSVCMGRSDRTNVRLALWRAGHVQWRCWEVTSDWDVVLNPRFKHTLVLASYVYSMHFRRLGSTAKLFVARNIIWYYLQIAFLYGWGEGKSVKALEEFPPCLMWPSNGDLVLAFSRVGVKDWYESTMTLESCKYFY